MVSTRWIWVACLAMLFAGLTNAHLHYCFDGQEPPVSVHLTDGIDRGHDHHELSGHGAGHEHEQDHDEDQDHHDDLDVDLNLADQALAKVLKLDQPDMPLFGGWSVVLVSPPATALVEWLERPPTHYRPYARPQSRGPPA